MAYTPSTSSLQKEVQLLRSFVIGMVGKDPEGEYRPEFVEQILRTLEETPHHEFTDSKTFLAHLRENA